VFCGENCYEFTDFWNSCCFKYRNDNTSHLYTIWCCSLELSAYNYRVGLWTARATFSRLLLVEVYVELQNEPKRDVLRSTNIAVDIKNHLNL
jgi:hypothetical protein